MAPRQAQQTGKHREFGQRFANALQHSGLAGSYASIGKKFGVTPTTVGNLLNGHKLPSTELLIDIAKKTSVNADWLITGRGTMATPDQAGAVVSNVHAFHGRVTALPIVELSEVSGWRDMSANKKSQAEKEMAITPLPSGKDDFFVRILGEAMDDGTREGYPNDCLAQFFPSDHAEHQDDVIAELPDGKPVFRRLHITGEGDYLIALNENFPNRIMEKPPGTKILAVCLGAVIHRRKDR